MSRIRILRLESDVADFEDWLARGGSRWARVIERSGRPPSEWTLSLLVPGVAGFDRLAEPELRRAGPFAVRDRHTVRLAMPEDYPFRPPMVHFVDRLFHPNVFANGRLCWGIAENDATWWRGGDGLGTLVERLLHIVVGDPQCTNPRSPANVEAVVPYEEHARLFPLTRLELPAAKGGAARTLRLAEPAP